VSPKPCPPPSNTPINHPIEWGLDNLNQCCLPGQEPACNAPVMLTCCWTDGLPAEKVASSAPWPRCRLPMDNSRTAGYANSEVPEIGLPRVMIDQSNPDRGATHNARTILTYISLHRKSTLAASKQRQEADASDCTWLAGSSPI
jgi:hypothetical protein